MESGNADPVESVWQKVDIHLREHRGVLVLFRQALKNGRHLLARFTPPGREVDNHERLRPDVCIYYSTKEKSASKEERLPKQKFLGGLLA